MRMKFNIKLNTLYVIYFIHYINYTFRSGNDLGNY